MLTTVHGVIVHTLELPDRDRLVWIFTRESGLLTAVAMGKRSPRVSYMAASQIFCYGEFVLYSKSDDKYWIREIELQEPFLALRSSIEKVALATYLCDVIKQTATNQPDVQLLRLLLNSLYALTQDKYVPELIKATFEFRAATILGFMPDVSGCCECGGEEGGFYVNVMEGFSVCERCHALYQDAAKEIPLPAPEDDRINNILLWMPPRAFQAVRYCIQCPLEHILAFSLEGEDLYAFAHGAETYLLNHLERSFASLDFYKKLI